ncbi:MAG TPA: TIGR03621 family F420-dependent LLM class oxidoreductase [Thermomicrobiales bacterium]|jgi:probable F420-dependent oxidoreductase|nr:TIGR03621 family F420-dependent LLM class oxidoreductase [Thermomicrobiales bacterium]
MPKVVHQCRFGVIAEQIGNRDALVDLARRAEVEGFHTLLIRDHVEPDYFGVQLGPIAALATVAAVTERLRIGTLVFANDYRHPAILAKDAATLDVLSGGRLELGIGAGWLRSEYAAMGMPFDPNGVRVGRLEESLRLLAALFAGGSVDFAGEYYRVTGHELFPVPVQRPRPPLLVGAGHPRMLRIAGRHADIVGLLTTSVASGAVEDDPVNRQVDHVERQLGWVREGAGERFEDLELSSVLTVIRTDDREGEIDRLIAERRWSGITRAHVDRMPAIAIGTTRQIADHCRRWRERLRLTYFVVSSDDLDAFAPVIRDLGIDDVPTSCARDPRFAVVAR